MWRSLIRRFSPVIVGGLIATIGLWAAWATTSARPPVDVPDPFVTYTVAEETVERSLPIIVVAERSIVPVAVNHLQGVITRVADLREPVPVGTVVYEVAGVPVRLVEGAVPFYRDLGPGVEGEDVFQLQAALFELGYLQSEPDGRYAESTSEGVREWRRDLGLEDGEDVALGEVIAVPSLPRLVRVADEIATGRLVAPGSDAISLLSEPPTFEAPLSDAQAQTIDPAAVVVIEFGDLEWRANIASSQIEPEQGQVVLTLVGEDGGAACGSDCDSLPAEERLQLRGRVVSVPATTGPAVPVAALDTDAQGRARVRLESGAMRRVTIVAIAGGLAIVEGVEVGERVQLIGQSDGNEDG